MSGPLAGIRVVDLTSAVLGPVATQILGDMGADVIKIEPPEGDPIRPLGPSRHPGMGAYFLNINRNKRSVALDLKQPAAREALLKLVETADVFVHNMRLGAAERLGLDYSAVAGRNPRIVYAAASGFRKDGAYRDRPSFDDVIQGESGLAALNGGPGGEPRYVPMAVCDKVCGYALASAVSMALFHRERSGKGQEVHVPMLETMVAFNLADHLWHGVLAEPEKGLGYPRMLTEHRRPFPTKDGHICILATTDSQSRHLFEAIDCPELADDHRFSTLARRTDNIGELYGIIIERMSRRTTAEWREPQSSGNRKKGFEQPSSSDAVPPKTGSGMVRSGRCGKGCEFRHSQKEESLPQRSEARLCSALRGRRRADGGVETAELLERLLSYAA